METGSVFYVAHYSYSPVHWFIPSGPTAQRLPSAAHPAPATQPSSGDAGGSFDGTHPSGLAFAHRPSELLSTQHNCFSVSLAQRWCRFSLCAVKGDLSSKKQRPTGTSESLQPTQQGPLHPALQSCSVCLAKPCQGTGGLKEERCWAGTLGVSFDTPGTPFTYPLLASPIAKEQEQLFSSFFFHLLYGVEVRTFTFNYHLNSVSTLLAYFRTAQLT